MKKITIILMLLISLTLIADSVTLDEAINIALDKNENVLTAKEDLQNSKYKFHEALANAFPTIDATMTAVHKSYTSNDMFDQQEDKAFDGELTIVQPLWVGGKVGTGIKIAKVYNKLSKEAFELEKAKTRVSVTESFNNVLLAKEAFRVIKTTRDNAQENLRIAEVMFEQELISEYELIKARVRVKSLDPMVIEYQNNYKLALDSFKTELGLELDSEIELSGTLEYSDVVVDTLNYKERVLAKRRELSMLKKQNTMYKQYKRIAVGDLLPTIAAVGSYTSQSTQDEFSDLFEDDFNIRKFNVGLNVTIPIFHGGGTYARINQAKSSIRKSDLQIQRTTRLLQLEAEAAYKTMNQAYEEIGLQEDVVRESTKALEIANIRFRNGVGSQIEVIDAQTELQTSQLNLLAAVHKYTNAVVNFNYTSGIY